MQALTNRKKEVSRKPMNFMERMYIPAILKGMAITFSIFLKNSPTIRYPEQTRPVQVPYSGDCMC